MKKALCLLLILCLAWTLWGCAQAAPPEESPAPGESPAKAEGGADPAREGLAFAAALAYWDMDAYQEVDLKDPHYLWSATGWYAAWLSQTQGVDLISRELVEDFQLALGAREPAELPEYWEDSSLVQSLRDSDGTLRYDFAWYKQELPQRMGVDLELKLSDNGPDAAVALLRYHFSDGASRDWAYLLRFVDNERPDSRFPQRVERFSPPDQPVELDRELDFDWPLLREANRLSSLLSIYGQVRTYTGEAEDDYNAWCFLRDGEPVFLSRSGGKLYGQFRDYYFVYGQTEDGHTRAQITGRTDEYGEPEGLEGTVSEYLSGLCLLKRDRVEDDLIWTLGYFRDGSRKALAFDRGTLALRQLSYTYDEDYPPSVMNFSYLDPPPSHRFMDSWDKPLRHVSVIWEEFPDGEQALRREELDLPADWEYYPDRARWGGYTIYMDMGYTQSYRYPGDGKDYGLFITQAKG